MSTLPPFHLQPVFEGRTWGRQSLSPWYPTAPLSTTGEPIGEAWLTGPECIAGDGPYAGTTLGTIAKDHTSELLGAASCDAEFPLLVKLLFPDAKLSVQVHPNDEEARSCGVRRGKTECWYVLEAAPDATVACGLRPGVSIDDLRTAIANGTAEDLLVHLPVRKGDMVFVDAGTVHALGPGVTILEVQQTCDTTYRLFDYGRPRELHLEKGLAVSKISTRAGKVAPIPTQAGTHAGTRLIAEQYFTVDSFPLSAGDMLTLTDATDKPHCLIALYGDVEIVSGDSKIALPAGSAAILPAGIPTTIVKAFSTTELIRATP